MDDATFGLAAKIADFTGIPPAVFLLISGLVTGLVAGVRRATAPLNLEEKPWWKLALFGIAMALGILVAFVANATGNYGHDLNWADILLVCFANVLIADVGWKFLKAIPSLRARVTVTPPTRKSKSSPKEPKE